MHLARGLHPVARAGTLPDLRSPLLPWSNHDLASIPARFGLGTDAIDGGAGRRGRRDHRRCLGCGDGRGFRGGAEGVGQVTTRSVVQSITLIVVADMIFAYVSTH